MVIGLKSTNSHLIVVRIDGIKCFALLKEGLHVVLCYLSLELTIVTQDHFDARILLKRLHGAVFSIIGGIDTSKSLDH